MGQTLRGTVASMRWGYHVAAEMSHWELTAERAADTASLTATVTQADHLHLQQQPLRFVVPRPKGRRWVWPVVSVMVSGQYLAARLGPQEE